MPTPLAEVFVEARLDTRHLSSDLSRGMNSPTVGATATRSGEQAGSRFSTGMRTTSLAGARRTSYGVGDQMAAGAASAGLGYGRRFGVKMREGVLEYAKTTAGLVAGYFAFEKINEFVRGSVEAAEQAEKAARTTEAVITSTGGAANVTLDHVEALSAALGEQAGAEDDLVQAGANMLLTFRNVRNEQGKNNQIFDEGLQSVLDISAAMAGAGRGSTSSLKASAIQVGRALNDPVRGVTALMRVGVQFTDQQKEQIARLVENGHLLSAQKIILGELQTEFAGTAAAQASWGDKAHAQLYQLEEDFGRRLLPAAEAVEQWFAEDGVTALRQFGSAIDTQVIEPVGTLTGLLRPLLDLTGELPSGFAAGAIQLGVMAGGIRLLSSAALPLTRRGGMLDGLAARTMYATDAIGRNGTSLGRWGRTLGGVTKSVATSRIGVGLLGVGLAGLDSAVGDSSETLHDFLGVASSAAIGFSAGGAWGAAIGGGIGLLQAFSDSNKGAQIDVEGLTATLDEQTGALTQNSREWASKQVIDNDALGAANALGIGARELTSALLGQGDAADNLTGRLQALVEAGTSAAGTTSGAGFVITDESADNAAKLLDLLGAAPGAAEEARAAWKFTHDAEQGAASASDDLTDSLKEQEKAARADLRAHNALADALVGDRQGMIGFRDSVREAVKGTKDFEGSIFAQTKAADEQKGALLDVASAWNGLTARQQSAHGAYEKARDDFLRVADAMGVNEGKAEDLAQTWLKLPKGWKPEVDLDTDPATRKLSAFKQHLATELADIPDEPVDIKLSAQAAKVAATLARFGGEPMQSGGPVTGGTPGKDSVVKLLMPGEHVITAAEVARAGGHGVITGLRRLMRSGELHRVGDIGMAAGGPVLEGSFSQANLSSAIAGTERTIGAIAAVVGAVVSKSVSQALASLPTGLGPGGRLTPAQIVRGQDFLTAQGGKPYLWGGVGPAGYDCTGIQSAGLNAAMGRYPYRRIGSTATAPWPGSAPGVGRYTIGWSTNVGGSGIGHASGNIGGLGIESAGGVGVRLGGAARSPLDSMFHGLMHYDAGGVLLPGTTVAHNTTGEPETVTTAKEARQQARALERILRAISRLDVGARDDAGEVRSKITDLIGQVRDDLGRQSPLIGELKGLRSEAAQAARDRDEIRADLSDARDHLRELTQERRQFIASARQSFTADPFGQAGARTAQGIIAFERDAVARTRRYLRAETKLIHEGLDRPLIRQLVGNGPDALPAIEALAAAPLPRLHELEDLAATQRRLSGRIGSRAGGALYDAGISAAQGVVRGLERNEDRISRQLEHIIERAIHSIDVRAAGEGRPHRPRGRLAEHLHLHGVNESKLAQQIEEWERRHAAIAGD